MIIDFENIEDAIYQEIKEEMMTCDKFDRETCSKLTKKTIKLANASYDLLRCLEEIVKESYEDVDRQCWLDAKKAIKKATGIL